MSRRRRVLVLCASAALVIAPATPAAAQPATAQVTPRDRATAAAAKVDALLDTYTQATAVEAKGLRTLAGAVAAQSSAEVTAEQAAANERAARGQQADRVRALYAQGGTAGLLVSVLDATSPDDLLQRIGTADRIARTVLADDRTAVQQQAATARRADNRRAEADAAATRQAAALQHLEDRSQVAADALAEAKQTLARLDAKARQAAAAERAARLISAAEVAAGSARSAAAGPMTALDIPAEYQADYQAAAKTCPGMDWTLLAGVGQVESGHGRNMGPSSAGAVGPMQFMPATFAYVGVDGDGDGRKDAWDPEDAIFSAARYLCVSGARGGSVDGIHRAILAYNHAEWYADLVLSAQAAIQARIGQAQISSGSPG